VRSLSEELKRLNFNVPKRFQLKVKRFAADMDEDMATVVVAALNE
jgi:hypothetical protein